MIHVYHPGRKGKVPLKTIVFVCQHGGAKSLIASEYFTRIAAQRGIDLKGVCVGLEPYAEVPAPVVSGLAEKGIDVSGFTPQPVTADTFAAAMQVVHFGCELEAFLQNGLTVEDWGDVP